MELNCVDVGLGKNFMVIITRELSDKLGKK
jgi:hypothetical protein